MNDSRQSIVPDSTVYLLLSLSDTNGKIAMKFSLILTASELIAAVQAVALHVAVIAFRDALLVAAAGELVVTAGGSRGRGRTAFFVAAIGAILVAVAVPQLADALLIIATELIGLASVRTCQE